MKRLGRLVSWHWHLVRRPFILLCGVYGAQQMALLLLSAARKETLGMQMADLFMGCGQLPLFFVTLYLVLLTAASATRSGGRSHMMYTPVSYTHLRVRNIFVVHHIGSLNVPFCRGRKL